MRFCYLCTKDNDDMSYVVPVNRVSFLSYTFFLSISCFCHRCRLFGARQKETCLYWLVCTKQVSWDENSHDAHSVSTVHLSRNFYVQPIFMAPFSIALIQWLLFHTPQKWCFTFRLTCSFNFVFFWQKKLTLLAAGYGSCVKQGKNLLYEKYASYM